MCSQPTVSCNRGGSARHNHAARVNAQTWWDAKLNADFEEYQDNFNYCTTIDANISDLKGNIPASAVSSYLHTVQRGKLIQPFGCLLTVNEENFTIIAYSENAPDMLGLMSHAVPSNEKQEILTIGSDALSLFCPSSSSILRKAASYAEISLLNPIHVQCRNSGENLYAILHRIDVGLVIDLEPVNSAVPPVVATAALKSYQLAAKSISRLQSLPSGNISRLCDVLVQEMSDLTGYDRVMVYKFHEDEHGEVISECKRSDLEPYLGLHYPATDIPQAARFLFMKNKVRMICDCSAPPVKIIQDKQLSQPISLGGSTLRAPHGCHAQYMANMGSVASLAMSVTLSEREDDTVNEQKRSRLWGLVVCHHTSYRFTPFPLRNACAFLVQVFTIQLNKEVELAAQMRERHIIQIQSMLSDMLLRDAPTGIMTRSPNVMDLVKCDGAALYYHGKCWLLGTTPHESQIRDVVKWLLQCSNGIAGFSTDSLVEAGCPCAHELRDSVCGLAAVRITDQDFIFWFRSGTANEIKWGGAKHNVKDEDGDGKKMHPRSSFMAFLEVVKFSSLPWKDVDIDAIHSLHMILRWSLQKKVVQDLKKIKESVLCDELKIEQVHELHAVTNEMTRLIETAAVPILAMDASGNINGWNSKVAELTGLPIEQVLGTPLVQLVDRESVEVVKDVLLLAVHGKERSDVRIGLKTFSKQGGNGSIMLEVNTCCSRDLSGNIVGVCLVAQDLTTEKLMVDKYTRVQGDYNAIIMSPNALIPPIFITNEFGYCIEWNSAMQKLSGLDREEVIDQILVGEIFGLDNSPCLVGQDMLIKLRIVLNGVIAGQEVSRMLFGFYSKSYKYVECLLSASKRTDSEGKITGALCFLHVASLELREALKMQRITELVAWRNFRKLTCIRQKIQNPLHGVMFTRIMMEAQDLTKEQRQLLRLNTLCEEQLANILDDTDIESIEESYLDMCIAEFNLTETLEAVIIQAMPLSEKRQVRLIHDLPPQVSSVCLYGDKLRLQQFLSDFLVSAIQFTPVEGWVALKVLWRTQDIGTSVQVAHLEFRIIHPSPGIPDALIEEMFHQKENISKEGLSLCISHVLVKIMNGEVQYLREADRSSLIILVEFPISCHVVPSSR